MTRIYYATVPAQTDAERAEHPSSFTGPSEVHLMEPVNTYEWAEFLPDRFDQRTTVSLGSKPQFCCSQFESIFRHGELPPDIATARFCDGEPPIVKLFIGSNFNRGVYIDEPRGGGWWAISFCPFCGSAIECVSHLKLTRRPAKVVVDTPRDYETDVLEVDSSRP